VTSVDIEEILKSGNRGKSMVMPPWGLYLEEVYYKSEEMEVK